MIRGSIFQKNTELLHLSSHFLAHVRSLIVKPCLEDNGLLTCNGGLQYAQHLPYDIRYPMIPTRKNWISKLKVNHNHLRRYHSTVTNQTLAMLCGRYWVMHGKEEIRECEGQCCDCRRRRSKASTKLMVPLPGSRLQLPLRPFARAAVDYGGPFYTITGRGKRRAERYLSLFTCLTSRAVHLKIAFALDSDSFLNAFYRMVNR